MYGLERPEVDLELSQRGSACMLDIGKTGYSRVDWSMPSRESLQDKERRFQLLFEDHPQPMWVMDAAGHQILEANAAAAELYGFTRDQFRGMSLEHVRVSEDRDVANGDPRRHRTSDGRVID